MKVRKIAALAVGAAMVGATIGFASAQPTVPNIPKEFFVKDGEPNVKIVVGSQAAAADVASAADIAVALGSLLYTEKEASVSEASITIKKDVTTPVISTNPSDIPVFFNWWCVHSTSGIAGELYHWSSKEKVGDVHGWWNGSDPSELYYEEIENWETPDDPWYYPNVYQSSFNVTFDNSVWNDEILNITEASGLSGYNPLDFTAKDAGYIKLKDPLTDKEHDVTFDEGKIIDYHITINQLQLVGLADIVNSTTPSAFNGIKIKIPQETATVSMNFTLNEYSYVPCAVCEVKEKYYVDDTSTDTLVKSLRPGLTKGDTLTLFGENLTVVAVNETLEDFGTYDVVFGKPYEPVYIATGESKQFGDYSVEVIDIDVTSSKALLKVTDKESGVSKIITLYTETEGKYPYYKVLFDGGIYVKLKNVFIGIQGTTTAEVEVATDLKGINTGDEVIPGWIAKDIVIYQKDDVNYLQKLVVTNKNDLVGQSLTLADLYKIQYNVESKSYSCDTGTCYAAKVWIDFDPITKTEEKSKEVGLGDEIDGWKVDSVKVEGLKEYEIYHPTEPITYLDTEIDLAAVDSNLILVGGPVVNAVTAALADALGVPKDYNGWKEEYGTGADSGVVKYIEECEKINGYGVVLVAGTDREGTREAAKALMEYLASLG